MTNKEVEKYDLYSKVALGIIGIIFSGILGWSQINIQKEQLANTRSINTQNALLQEKQNKQNAVLQQEQNKLQVLEMVNHYLPYYGEQTERGKIASAIVINAASKLSISYGYPDLAQLLNGLKNSQITPELELKLSEATLPTVGDNGWFCVIGSYRTPEESRSFQNSASIKLSIKHIVIRAKIYKAKNGFYAVTLGDILSQSTANEYVQIARANDIAHDAFSQVNRHWQIIQ